MKPSPFRLATLLLPAVLGAGLLEAAAAAGRPTPSSSSVTLPSSDAAATIEGKLHVFYADDFEHHRASVLYFVEDVRSRKLYRVRPSRLLTKVGRSGGKVSLSGTISGETLTLDASGTQAFESTLAGTETSGSTSEATVAGAASQSRNTIVMVASFQDAGAECMVDTIQNTLFGAANPASVDALYQETSLGQLGFNGNVVGPYAVADTATGKCDLAGWASALDAKAQAAGYNLSQYQNKVYVLPSQSSCAVGMGSVGGSPGVAYISRCGLADAYAHELGHNLALNHASTPGDQYGDMSDIMGYSGVSMRGLNAPHLQQLGWRVSSQVQRVTSSGTFDLAPLELDASQAVAGQMLRVPKADTGEEYYVSYRQPIGLDASLSTSYQRVTVHRYANAGGRTYLMGTYADGASFVDSTNGITITAVSHSSSYATVQVQVGAGTPPPTPVCTRTAPAITLSPSSQNGTAGQTLNYGYTILNRDTAECGSSTFSASRSVPTGWSGSLSTFSVTLTPGQSGSGMLSLTSPSSAAAGTWSAAVNVSNAAVEGHAASGAVSAILGSTADTQAPTAPGTLSANANRKKMNITLTWGSSSDNVGVAGYEVWRDGVLAVTTAGTSWVDAPGDTATHSYFVKAFDAAGNRSAASATKTATLANTRRR